MRTNFFSVAAVTLGCIFSAAKAQEVCALNICLPQITEKASLFEQWNAVFTNNGGFAFLDSNNAKIETTSQSRFGQTLLVTIFCITHQPYLQQR